MFNSDVFRLISRLTLIAAVSTAACLGVDAWYRSQNNFDYIAPSHIFLDPPLHEKYQLVALGNSHAQSGLSFANYKLKSLNLSSVAQRFSLDLAVLRQHSRQIAPGAIIIIPVTPISFAHRIADQSDSLQTNYYASVSPFLIPHLQVGNYIESMLLPFSRSGYQLRKQHDERIKQRLAEENRDRTSLQDVSRNIASDSGTLNRGPMKPSKEILLARPDFSLFPAGVYSDNVDFLYHKWYQTDEFNPKYFPQNQHDLEAIIRYCLDHQWKPILITIPISEAARSKLLPNFMDVYLYDNLKRTDTYAVPYFDYSNDEELSLELTNYANGDHLNSRGAALFSYKLLQTLIEEKYVPSDVDNFEYHKKIQ